MRETKNSPNRPQRVPNHSDVRATWEEGRRDWRRKPLDPAHIGYVPFDAWSKSRRESLVRRDISEESLSEYRYVWKCWLKFLDSRNPRIAWQDATSSDVADFLGCIQPSASGKTRASPVSWARYKRVLGEVYEHACAARGDQEDSARRNNPVQAVKGVGSEKPSEAAESLRLTRHTWDRLVAQLPARPEELTGVRNLAILSLIMFDGFSVSDLLNLSLPAVHAEKTAEGTEIEHRSPLVVDLVPLDRRAERTVTLSQRSSDALDRWLGARAGIIRLDTDRVFVSRERTSLTSKSVFLIVREFFARACLGESHDGELPAHMGPNVLRNGCIQRWIEDGVAIDEAAARLGQLPRSLKRLLDRTRKAAA